MSYLRDDFYVWAGKGYMHIEHTPSDSQTLSTLHQGSVAMPIEKFDEVVAKRWAEMDYEQRGMAVAAALQSRPYDKELQRMAHELSEDERFSWKPAT